MHLEIRQKLEDMYQDKLQDIYDEHNIDRGDITPDQQIELDNILDDLTDLTVTLFKQNEGKWNSSQ